VLYLLIERTHILRFRSIKDNADDTPEKHD
jgi:hypothetical protein